MSIFGNNKTAEEWCNQSESLMIEKRFDEAISCIDEAIKLEPNDYSCWQNKAHILYLAKRFDESFVCCEKALKLKPNNSFVWNLKSAVLHDMGKFEEALSCINEALKLKPNNANFLRTKGGVLKQLEKFPESLSCIDQAIELEPNNANNLQAKSAVLAQSYRFDEAMKFANSALELEPTNQSFLDNSDKILNKMYKTQEYCRQENISYDRFLEEANRVFYGEVSQVDLVSNFSRLSWKEAENLVGKLFEKKGYSVQVTGKSGDFGIDVEAKSDTEYLGIQVKHWSMDVGFEDVAKTLGVSSKFNKVIIVSTKSGFTSQAMQFAGRDENRFRLELWNGQRFKQELKQFVIGK